MEDQACTAKNFELIMRQQPVHSRMCGFGERVDRRPIDPPPVVQVKLENNNLKELAFDIFLVAVLVPANADNSQLNILQHSQLTVGRTVSSLYHLRDLDDSEAAFFVFSDISIRTEGHYRLKMCLFEIIRGHAHFQTSILTEPFTVYSAKSFPGMYRSCPLVQSFAKQGLKIRVRRESAAKPKLIQSNSQQKVVPRDTIPSTPPTISNILNDTSPITHFKRFNHQEQDIPNKRRLSLSYLLDQNENPNTYNNYSI